MWRFLNRYHNFALFFLRLGLGLMMVVHGWPKMIGGPDRWYELGLAMRHLGIDFVPTLWGLAAALSETAGGLGLILGLFTRPACLALTVTMAVAATMHLGRGDSLLEASHAIELGIVFFSLLFLGPGRYSVDRG